ncbi:MAG: glucokinase, partial [Thermus sp.]
MRVIGLDLGGTKIAAGLFEGDRLLRKEVFPTPKEGGEEVVRALAQAARALGLEGVKAVGLGTPGPLDFQEGVIRFTPNIPGVRGLPIKRLLEAELGLPVFLENDANAAA